MFPELDLYRADLAQHIMTKDYDLDDQSDVLNNSKESCHYSAVEGVLSGPTFSG